MPIAKSKPLKLNSPDQGDLKRLSSTEENYLSYLIGQHFCADSDGDNEIGNLTLTSTNANTVGSFVDTLINEPSGTHPTSAITSTSTTTTLYQKYGTADETDSDFTKPIAYYNPLTDGSTDLGAEGVYEMADSDMNRLVDRLNGRIALSDYLGSFKLSNSTTSPGAGYVKFIEDVFTDNIEVDTNTTDNFSIWRRESQTAPSSITDSDGNTTLLSCINRDSGGNYLGIGVMSDRAIKVSLGQRAKTRRSASDGIGSYVLRSSSQGAPSGSGSWRAVGSATNRRRDLIQTSYTRTRNSTYTRDRQSTYAGIYNRTRVSNYTRNRTSTYSRNFVGDFVATYQGNYIANFIGNYSRGFVGNYSRNFAGNYIGDFIGNYQRGFVGNYTGDFTGNYARNFLTGYSRNFTRDRTSNQTAVRTQTRTSSYSRTFSRVRSSAYTRTRTSYYSRNSVANRNSQYNRTSTRTRYEYYSRSFAGNYARAYTRDRQQTRHSTYNRTFIGNYSRNYTRFFTGDYTRNSFYNRTAYYNRFRPNPNWDPWNAAQGPIYYLGVYSRNIATEGPLSYSRSFTGNYSGNAPNYSRTIVSIGPPWQWNWIAGEFPSVYTRTSQYTAAFQRVRVETYNANFTRNRTSNYARAFTRDRISSYARLFVANYIGNYQRVFTRSRSSNFSRDFGGNFIGDYARTFIGDFTGNYSRDFGGNYSRNFTRNRNSAYSRNFIGNYTGDFLANYIGNYARNYFRVTRTSTYTRNSTRDSQRTIGSDYTRNSTRDSTRVRSSTYTRTRSSTYTRDSTVGPYTRNRNSNFTATRTSSYSRDFIGDYTRGFLGDYIGDYARGFIGNYSRTFTGNYTGETVGSSTELIETYTLYVKYA